MDVSYFLEAESKVNKFLLVMKNSIDTVPKNIDHIETMYVSMPLVNFH